MAASTALQVLVSPLLGTVFDNLSSLIRTEIGLVWGVNKELEKLSSTLSTIRDVLEDAEYRQITKKPICNWLRKLKNVAYDAEDVLDEFATEAALRSDHQIEVPGTNKGSNSIHEVLTNSVSSFFNLKRISFRRKIAKRIKRLVEKFDEIAKERSKFHLITNFTPRDVQSGEMHHRETSSVLGETQVFGREEEKEQIVNQLLNNTEVDDVSVCVILGMGGLGKTTLAQMVHHDDRIVKHFEVRCWVCVSENFETKAILKAIIESSGGSTQDLQNLDPLQHRLREILGGKRFLVVLDDVWNEDQAKWENLKSSLSCGTKGSSIIITTRLDRVESITATLLTCRPKKLSDEDCWSLFKNRAFDMCHNEENHPTLEVIGRQIVKKCRGIPLAAKFLGGLLRFKRKDSEWVAVRDSEIWDLPQDKADAILPALRLSYEHLPLNMRQCFVYCSIYPKDYKIKIEMLIRLWIANGFVQSAGQNMELEDVGDAIFNDLSCRSFFQDVEKDETNKVSSCKMHDLVHDLASSIMKDECLFMEVGKEYTVGKKSTNVRHLSLHFEGFLLPSMSLFPEFSPHTRTLVLLEPEYGFWSYKPAPPLQLIFSRLKCLRALDLSQMDISIVPDSIGNLKHLRYLDLSGTKITSLPNESFCRLINLQVLKLVDCYELRTLPQDMWRMSSLRHLEIRGCRSLTQTPMGIRKLICLQTLSLFIAGTESGRGITELQGLNRLRGELEVKGLEHVRNSIDARNANLMKKQNLHSLALSWSEDENSTTEEEVLLSVGDNLQPNPCIKRLKIKGFGGATLPSWMKDFSSLPNLVEVSLFNCIRCEHLSSLGELRLLKVLLIEGMDSVKCIGDEFYASDHRHHQGYVFFPSLENLDIRFMPNLEEFSSPSSSLWSPSSSLWSPSSSSSSSSNKLLAFPCLKELWIWDCPKLRRLISFPSSIKKLTILECNEMALSISLENLPATNCLSVLTIGLSEVISFPKVGRMTWMKLSNLTDMGIYSCPDKTLPKELLKNLTALTELHIFACDEFIHLPEGMQYLISLRNLWIKDCRSLKSLHEGLRHLTTLEKLIIQDCPELEFLPEDDDNFQHLISLKYLHLKGLSKMTSLPTVAGWSQVDNNLISVPTLVLLSIVNCSALTTLPEWIPNLTSLGILKIEGCKNLKSLPNEGLTALLFLRIEKCHPDLHRRCEEDKGDDWHKISHIPWLTITD